MDVYSIGEMLIDFIPGNEPASYVRNAGGAPANVAIAVARNGLDAGMNCSLGDDDFGRFLKETLEENNVRIINPVLTKDAVTTLAFVTLDADGDRSFTFVRKPGADILLSEDTVKETDIAEAVIVHAGSCSLSVSPEDRATIKALRLAHEMGKLVSFDVNYRDVMWSGDQEACAARVRECLPYVDILKISEDESDMLGGENSFRALIGRYGISLIVETLGSRGARCFIGSRVIEVPGRKAKCVDATGAGDAFWGGFLSRLRINRVTCIADLTEEIILDSMEYGNTAGWLCVQSKGAITSLPTREETEKYL